MRLKIAKSIKVIVNVLTIVPSNTKMYEQSANSVYVLFLSQEMRHPVSLENITSMTPANDFRRTARIRDL